MIIILKRNIEHAHTHTKGNTHTTTEKKNITTTTNNSHIYMVNMIASWYVKNRRVVVYIRTKTLFLYGQ